MDLTLNNALTIKKGNRETVFDLNKIPDTIKENYYYDVKTFQKWLSDNSKQTLFYSGELLLNYSMQYINDYLENLKENDYSFSTIAKKRIALKQHLKATIGNMQYHLKGLIDSKFKDEVKGYKVNSNKTTNYLKRFEIEEFISKATPRISLIVKTLFYTGMRISELIGIKLTACKIKNNTVEIKIIGKGNKQRIIYIPIKLFEKTKEVFNGKKYLFETRGHRIYSRVNIYKELNRQGKKLLKKNVYCHQLRHSFGTYQIQVLKQDLKKVSEYLGHSDISITGRFYLKEIAEAKDFFNENGELI